MSTDFHDQWKWTVRLAKEYDLLARKPELSESQRQVQYNNALTKLNELTNRSLYASSYVPSSAKNQISFIQANLLLKTGMTEEQLRYSVS